MGSWILWQPSDPKAKKWTDDNPCKKATRHSWWDVLQSRESLCLLQEVLDHILLMFKLFLKPQTSGDFGFTPPFLNSVIYAQNQSVDYDLLAVMNGHKAHCLPLFATDEVCFSVIFKLHTTKKGKPNIIVFTGNRKNIKNS